ncbi:MAG: SDR family NAD(P)-dependent oxidoreductase [Alphaproteobacteria bacterium]
MANSNQVLAHYPDLRGRSVFISGGATGIGSDLVRAFAAQAAITTFMDIDDHHGKKLERELQAEFGAASCEFIKGDVTSIEDLNQALALAESKAGGLYALINNAANDARHDFFSADEAFFDKAVAVNLKHQFFASQQAARYMEKRQAGIIINFGSVAPRIPAADLHIYIACKQGVRGLTRSMAKLLGPKGIRVNAIVPGAILTPKQLELWISESDVEEILKQQCLPYQMKGDHVAQMALFLSSNAAAGCAGHDFVVDGGLCF